MASLSTISTNIIVSGTALPTYPDRTPNQEPGTRTSYVQAISNATFAIHVRIPASASFLSDVLLFKVFKDEQFVTQKFVPADDVPAAFYIDSDALKFPYIIQDTNPNAAGDAHLWKDSEVAIQISHAKLVEPPGVDSFGNKTTGKVESLQGGDVWATTFKYRPVSVLREELAPSLPRDFGRADELDVMYPKKHERPNSPEPTATPSSNPAQPPSASARPTHPADTTWRTSEQARQDRNNFIFCTCRKIRPDMQFVTCDNEDCEIQAYHLDCVNLTEQPKTEVWLCPTCVKLLNEEGHVAIRMEGWTAEFGPFKEEWLGMSIKFI